MKVKKIFANQIAAETAGLLTEDKVLERIEFPKYPEQGDLAFPCFELAKIFKKNPAFIAKDLAAKITDPYFSEVVSEGPYVNCFLNKKRVSKEILLEIQTKQEAYGSQDIGKGEKVTIDFSSPNIAKPFSMGHLRSTVIGNAYANILEKCGYQPVRINHLGDWGTQFGKLISAYHRWGNEKEVRQDPIKELLKLYVRFHEEAEKDSKLEEEARLWFLKLEQGNERALELWQWFREVSLEEFKGIYKLLNVSFDSYNGEAFYNDKMEETIDLLKEKGLLSTSKEAEVVTLEEHDLPPCLIRKSDGATLYATRDLTAAIYRQKTYQFAKSVYVVGHEQSLHFKQVFLVLEKLGFEWANNLQHLPFGFILQNGKKMSTRKGKVVLLENVLKEAIKMAEKSIEEKNPTLQNKAQVAQDVGIGAIIFQDLKTDPQHSVEFSLEDMLRFEGATGPYVQYTHARACSILQKSNGSAEEPTDGLSDVYSWSVVKKLMDFPTKVKESYEQAKPSEIAVYLLSLCREFNKYYANCKILQEDDQQASRLALVECTAIVIKEGLRLLGIKAPHEM
ncbi:arginine--tRNA ligase [Oceanobacillus kapialis]|uniref:Arginine--tRNA ligase n=1 Tax=Oceanobacillus kapialis TaxID=481353 RepID=A0ABW5Q2E4_9BACI